MIGISDGGFELRQAHAVIGRPLTPMSYAGVARRTTRRAYRRGAYYGYHGGYAYPSATVITTLPAGCGFVNGLYVCGTARYRPYYDGPNLVYGVVP